MSAHASHRIAAVAWALIALTPACSSTTDDDGRVTPPPGPGGRCGERISAPAADLPLSMTPDLPASVPASSPDGLFRGRVVVTNRSSAPVQGTTASSPDLFVTRAGIIVAVPPPKIAVARNLDLAPGASVTYDAAGSVVACADGSRLASGRYEIHAELPVDSRTAFAGPWQLDIT